MKAWLDYVKKRKEERVILRETRRISTKEMDMWSMVGGQNRQYGKLQRKRHRLSVREGWISWMSLMSLEGN